MRVQKPQRATSSKAQKQFVWDDQKNDLVESRVSKNKKRSNTKLNMEKFVETLPQLEEKISNKKNETAGKETKQRRLGKKEALQLETEHFKKVLGHSAFKSNPIEAISTHIMNKFNKNK